MAALRDQRAQLRRLRTVENAAARGALGTVCQRRNYSGQRLHILPRRLHAAGFGGTTQRPITIVNRRFHPNSFSWWAAQLMGAYALGSGTLDRSDVDAWLSSLVDADAAGTHFLSSVPMLTVATALPGLTNNEDQVGVT